MVLYIYAGTLFLSAFILFLVQPIIGKLLLPKLGGTPQVWNTCMVFFQMVLLTGYAYTHAASTRLQPRRQLMIHAVLLLIPLIVLFMFGQPFNVDWWNAPPGGNPIGATLLLLLTIVGLPFFVVSTSAPLLQRWFVYTRHPAGKDPYFLYGASNLGSLLSLALYPTIIEHYLDLSDQAYLWAGMYVLFLCFVLYSAWTVWEPARDFAFAGAPISQPSPGTHPTAESGTTVSAAPPATQPKETGIKKGPAPKHAARDVGAPAYGADVETITPWRRARWIALAAVPSSLMLGVTTHVTTDLSPMPFFWLLPLMLYLLSFIFVFAKWPVDWVAVPHRYVLFAQPAAIALMLLVDWGAAGIDWRVVLFFQLVAFFLTALVCHGEMAKDRPSVRHLTEFYLMMSVGGMIGGMFNGLIAPVIPVPYVWEFSLAVVCACLFRPLMKEAGWIDDYVAGLIDQSRPAAAPVVKTPKGVPKPAPVALSSAGASPNLARTMDFVLPAALCGLLLVLGFFRQQLLARGFGGSFVLFGLPLMIACFWYARPLRLGLGIAAIIGFHSLMVGDTYLFGDRSYYGIIRVRALSGEQVGKPGTTYHSLMHGNIDHGMNFRKPGLGQDEVPTRAELERGDLRTEAWGNEKQDFSRLATTYYHRYGPVGVIMERWNWAETIVTTGKDGEISKKNTYWHWDQNEWHADARMPGAIIGLALADGQLGSLLPGAGAMVHTWSEPPLATVGLGTGTMASYARPYQAIHFYEIDNHVKKLSLPESPKGKVYFTYLLDAIARGADVHVYLGDAYQRMRLPYYNVHHPGPKADTSIPPGGPNSFYKMMVVDAFSSDAIPTHLLTQEAFKVYFDKLAPDGILCVHTSNRYVDLPKVVVDTANSLGFVARRAHDSSPFKGEGRTEHYTSEWVMVAREISLLQPYLVDPVVKGKSYRDAMKEQNRRLPQNVAHSPVAYWDDPPVTGRYVWTLDHSNLFNVLRSSRREDPD